EMFEGLGRGLQPLAEAILEVAGPRPEFLGRTSSTQAQESACRWIAEQLGFDFHSGRLDTSPHPFTSGIGAGDVRQTTRPEARGLLNAIYAVLHETGHGLYEQRIPLKLRGLPVGRTASFGMHESQSRLWENQVGRSRSFTDFLLPRLKDRFPEVLGDVPPDEFHRGVNHPERGPIRINADEVTYNLHLLVRFELGLALFRDELEVKDLPGAWNEKMESHLGIKPEDDASGVLQDMHWPSGNFGYFPTYTIGTLYGAAIFLEAGRQLPDLQREMRAGDTSSLLDWLTQNVYERAYRYPANRLVEQILGSKPSAQPFLTYLATKYSEIYDTDLSA
ncbi:MAG TPA: carboxypeptidase M32, partial [Actinomycetota bacterium]|nr:carboxypeptidase M32 [Actinomycetota bacterium]